MSDLLQSGQHPDADQLSAFVEHVLPAHEREETLAHLAVCPHCRSIVALSLPPVEEAPTPRPEPARRPWLSGWNLAWPATAAIAALVLGGIYVRNSSIVRNHVTPTQMAQSRPPAIKPAPAPTRPPQTPQLQSAPPVAKIVPKQQAITTLHITGRNIRGLEAPAPGSSALQGEASNNSPLSSVGALLPAAPAPSSTPVSVAAQSIQTKSAAVAGAFTLDQAQVMVNHRPLPSGLPVLSAAANGRQAVAIDAHNTLFLSDDAGGHWYVISPQWHGHVVKVELVSSSRKAGKSNSIGAAQPVLRTHLSPSPAGSPAPVDSAQGTKSSISGEVTDQTGAVIPSAFVVVTNSLTQAARTAKTDGSGRYTVDNLDPGTYTLEAEAPGFSPQQLSGVALNPAQKSQMDLKLAVGAVSQSVQVQTEDQLVSAPFSGFEITTDTGEHWTSIDGRSWMRKTVEK